MNRRLFMTLSATGLATGSWIAVPRALPVSPATKARIKAVAFAFPMFDPRPVFALAEELFPGAGLSDEWRTRQFEYTWLRVAAHHYADFWQVTGEALLFATTTLKLRLRPDGGTRLMNAYLALKPWPDVRPPLQSLEAAGLRLALLSNLTPTMFDPPGYETDLLYLACLATVVRGGSGPFAVDRLLSRLRARRV